MSFDYIREQAQTLAKLAFPRDARRCVALANDIERIARQAYSDGLSTKDRLDNLAGLLVGTGGKDENRA